METFDHWTTISADCGPVVEGPSWLTTLTMLPPPLYQINESLATRAPLCITPSPPARWLHSCSMYMCTVYIHTHTHTPPISILMLTMPPPPYQVNESLATRAPSDAMLRLRSQFPRATDDGGKYKCMSSIYVCMHIYIHI